MGSSGQAAHRQYRQLQRAVSRSAAIKPTEEAAKVVQKTLVGAQRASLAASGAMRAMLWPQHANVTWRASVKTLAAKFCNQTCDALEVCGLP